MTIQTVGFLMMVSAACGAVAATIYYDMKGKL
jgi:hypothetical protein